MTWPRPTPLVGDASSAAERAATPAGWAFPAAVRDGLRAVVDARRDVRRYRPDPVPEPVLTRVLAAAHAAPSVGHSQPWRFLVVDDVETRERAAVMADRERLREAAGMDPERARRLLDLQLEGIREAPLGVVVCCDRRAPAAGVLGRASFPDADVWSCACAIENLWLAARAEGLGVGWVTLFRPADLAGLLGLPDGVETLGWLCLGWPDERPPAPGLERAGWSR
ncbi:MAG: 5,6-dimethylbenzimidazole synthase, partial [Mycobacteriaceae bacterium]